jgi:hypothetical protein
MHQIVSRRYCLESPGCLSGIIGLDILEMKVRDAIRMLQDEGWILVRVRGSHRQFKHPQRPGLVTIAGIQAMI